MLLNNFYKLALFSFAGSAINASNVAPQVTTGSTGSRLIVMQYNTTPTSLPSSCYSNTNASGFPGLKGQGIAFGSDTTPPTINDIKLLNPITSGLSYGTAMVDYTSVLGVATWSQTVTNTSDSNITINEVGLFTQDDINNTQQSCTMLFTRSVVEPIVLEPNDTKVILVKIDFRELVDNISNT